MDSLTQITLGAAVGEVVLGKKAGNRAMIWGAVAGTIPDLDIIANFFTSDIHALAIHRGFSHSIVFAVITAPLFAWLIYQFYQYEIDRSKGYKSSITGLGILLCLAVFGSSVIAPLLRGESFSLNTTLIVVGLSALILRWLWKYYQTAWSDVGQQVTWREWSWLFFWSVFTHPLLDSLTAFGTQLFLPFSDYRVALNVISVADPIYTFPFLICLITASMMTRGSNRRAIANWSGIALSSIYMLWCINNKFKVNRIFESSLQHAEIPYVRYTNGPVIFNNVLWSGTAETEDAYYMGMYSINDKRPYIKFRKVPKNHDLLAPYEDTYEIKTLRWFSNGFFNVEKKADGQFVLNDLRYGSSNAAVEEVDKPLEFVFKFNITDKDGKFEVTESREMREEALDEEGGMTEMLKTVWKRAEGI